MEQLNSDSGNEKSSNVLALRRFIAILTLISIVAYVWGVVVGEIPESRKIQLTDLAVIAFALIISIVILNPNILSRFKLFEISGFKLEMLERVREKQAEQESRLDDIALILPLLLPPSERSLILKLADHDTQVESTHEVRSGLRRLRSVGLLNSKPGTHIADIKENAVADIATVVELTNLGNRWASRIRAISQSEENKG